MSYQVPTLEEIRAIPWNGYTVASLFAGGGGSSTGYRMAGYRVAYANDIVPEARETYKANAAPYTVVDGTDVREVHGAAILDAVEAVAGRRELDVLDGSPPCQAFSTAGPRHKSWGKVMDHADGTTQRSDDLFFEYARLLDEVRPRVFVGENVSGLVKGLAVGYFKRILKALEEPGYTVAAKLLDAQWLGVPQARQRLIFVGVREDLVEAHGVGPVHPRPLPYNIKLGEVLPTVKRIQAKGYGHWHVLDGAMQRPARTITTMGYSSTNMCQVVRQDGTVDTFTLDELKALQSFPPDYVLTGSYRQAWTRIGNSVPPLMMRAIAATIRDEILAKI